jgi:hypothetical protein
MGPPADGGSRGSRDATARAGEPIAPRRCRLGLHRRTDTSGVAWSKHRYGERLVSPAMKYDAEDALICECQTVGALVGIAFIQTLGWW